jgi:mRNA guanylyltransferase
MNVDFCNAKAFKIDSKELKEKIFLECDSLFGFSLKRNKFPGPQPVTIERKDLDLLKENYMVCEKSDGERAILLLLNLNGKPMCFMINRNNDFYFMDLSFKKEVFEGSIFDGELIKTKKGEWNYLIHDCFIYNGTSFCDMSHRLRYACIIDLINKRYSNKETDCVNIKTKLFYNYGPELVKTWECIKETTENQIDGLIFTPIDNGIKFGRDNTLFKWKEIHTIDFLVKLEKKQINLYYYKKDLEIFRSFKNKELNYKNIIEFLKKNDDDTDLEEGIIIEFKIDNLTKFIPYRLRLDKKTPNGEITVNNTLINIKEAIKIEEI